jgi:hypothetical protein
VAAALAAAPAATAAAPAPDAAPAAASAPAPAAASLPTIEGKVLEEKFPKPQPAADVATGAGSIPWLWFGVAAGALALAAFGWFRRPL